MNLFFVFNLAVFACFELLFVLEDFLGHHHLVIVWLRKHTIGVRHRLTSKSKPLISFVGFIDILHLELVLTKCLNYLSSKLRIKILEVIIPIKIRSEGRYYPLILNQTPIKVLEPWV